MTSMKHAQMTGKSKRQRRKQRVNSLVHKVCGFFDVSEEVQSRVYRRVDDGTVRSEQHSLEGRRTVYNGMLNEDVSYHYVAIPPTPKQTLCVPIPLSGESECQRKAEGENDVCEHILATLATYGLEIAQEDGLHKALNRVEWRCKEVADHLGIECEE